MIIYKKIKFNNLLIYKILKFPKNNKFLLNKKLFN